EAFGQFCRKHLCIENWEFIIDVVVYETTAWSEGGDERFMSSAHIIDEYLLPTSPYDVNISSAMSKRIACFRTRLCCLVPHAIAQSHL
ncbi:unnamed protein product, partial [Pylaiella littoralis]